MWGIDHQFDIDTLHHKHIQGRTFLITGANVGLGYESSKMLLERGGRVIMTCRKKSICMDAIKEMNLKPQFEKNAIFLAELNLSSLKSVKTFARAYKDAGLGLDVLMLNAGVMLAPYELTEDGIETHLAINHFGHAALTFELLDVLMESKYNPRVVIVSSAALLLTRRTVYLTLDEVNDPNTYSPDQGYARSKLANYLFGYELQRRIDEKYPNVKAFVNTLHPGSVATHLSRNILPWEFIPYLKNIPLMWDARTGALTQVGVAVDPSIEEKNIKGSYFYPVFREYKNGLNDYANDKEMAKKFWEFTVEVLRERGFETKL
jgi:NAD(P)-dependent dehydrogenase (short-subunit alcohol dehydrogenase family)